MLKRLLCVLLILSLVITGFEYPITTNYQADSEQIDTAENYPQITEEIEEKIPEQEISLIGEAEEKREENIKHFLRSDYTYEAAVYPVAVHYEENGLWKDIDNTLVSSPEKEGVLQNKSNKYKVEFSQESSAPELVKITRDGYELSWSLRDPPALSRLQVQQMQEKDFETDKRVLEKISSKVIYEQVYPQVDLRYSIEPQRVKEEIVLSALPVQEKFTFDMKVKDLKAEFEESGAIVFTSTKTGEVIYRIQKPFMYDMKEGYSEEIQMQLAPVKEGYELSIIPDRAFLESKDRVYPVIIDPVVETEANVLTIHDNHVSSAYPTTNYFQTHVLKTGVSSISGTNRTYIKFTDMPVLQSGDMIVEARLRVKTFNYANGTRVTAHRVSSAWDTNTMTWNTKASYLTNIEDYRIVQSDGTNYFWTITGVVRDWYIGNYSNNGIMLKADVEESNTYTEYSSSDCGVQLNFPALSIFYINSTGLEGYFDYESQSVGRAGSGHVNSFNGNLVFTHTGAATSGNKMPVSVVHVYNSNDRTTQLGYGNGWRTNFDQSVVPVTIGGTSYLRYIDDTGTDTILYLTR